MKLPRIIVLLTLLFVSLIAAPTPAHAFDLSSYKSTITKIRTEIQIKRNTRSTKKITPPQRIPSTPTPTATPTTKPESGQLTLDAKQQFILDEINKYRALHNLPPVKADPNTCSFAAVRAKEISTSFNHDGFRDRINSKTLPYPTYSEVTENLAMTSDYRRVVNLWINSPGHAANMRRDTPYVCVAAYDNYFAYEGWRP